jgi:pimeloyl-ACP methyl ester carboxylesterase
VRAILLIVLVVAVVLALLAVVTAVGATRIEQANPPTGRFVAVDGGRLHLLELGRSDALPVVLLHGASGNLADLRLALGERLASRYRVILIDRPGHGWSDRPDGRGDATPARQAELIHQALAQIGVTRAIILGHSWGGTVAAAYALAFPRELAGLVLLAPVTHPWPGGVALINHIVTAPVIGPLIAHTVILPAGYILMGAGVAAVFAPQIPPDDYVSRTALELLLRPAEFIANAQDLVALKAAVTLQAPRYGEIRAPAAIISGDDTDTVVSTEIHSRAIAAQMPQATLTVLPGVGHMVQNAAPDLVAAEVDAMIDEVTPPI